MNRFVGLSSILCAAAAAVPAHGEVLQFRDFSTTRFPSPVNEYSNQATLGDLDNDGDLDIIFANGGNFGSQGPALTQRVYINDGEGFFADESGRIGMSGWARGVELGDIDNDGDLDAIFAQDFNHVPQLFENLGDGTFTNITVANTPNISLSSSRAQFGDIDNDGDMDLYITNGGSSRFGCSLFKVYINDGTGDFTDESSTYHPSISICNNMDAIFGDIDGDFDLDVRTASTGSNNSRLFTNDGTGVLSLSTSIPNDSSCYSYDFADIDGDGDIDLLGVNAGSGSTELLLDNDGTGSFSSISSQISPNPSLDDNDSKFLDYDVDGDLDLLVGRLGSGGERLYENDGTGNFTQTSGLFEVVSDSTLDLVVGDLTNNGATDVVTAQGESGNYRNRIYLNNGAPDTLAPRIIDTEQLPDTSDNEGPYVVRAAVLDDMTSDRNFFYQEMLLAYSVNGGAMQTVDMLYSGGQIYRGEIPGLSCGSVEYWIIATDRAGNTGTSEEDTRTFEVTGGSPAGDANGDGVVDVEDLVDVVLAWGACAKCPEDLNGDGFVDVQDLVMVILDWGASCG